MPLGKIEIKLQAEWDLQEKEMEPGSVEDPDSEKCFYEVTSRSF